MMPTRAASVERPAFQISATSSSMSGYLAREMAELPSSSFESGTGQTKFRFDATIIRRGALQPRAAPRLWGKRTRSLSPLTAGFSSELPGAPLLPQPSTADTSPHRLLYALGTLAVNV